MEALQDRADDLMKSSALGSAEPIANICASCRLKLTKGAQSHAMNLHAIEARRLEAEGVAPETPERKVGQIADPTRAESEPAYQPGGGFKTSSDLEELEDSRMLFTDVKDFGSLLKWLATTKEGRNVAWISFIVLVIASTNMCSTNKSSAPDDEPVATETQPPSIEPPLEEAEPTTELPTTAVPAAPARPANNPGSWASTMDYPVRALNQGHEGTTGFRLRVNAQGAVTDCAITQSSGHPELDAATCSAISRRARFERAPVGSPDRGYANRVSWRIPKE